ncbi:MAG TPA: nitroreductase/quinone reductase family protein [Pseudonocardiaceae bacterium]
MNPVLKKTLQAVNAATVGIYRRSSGRIGGTMRGTDLLVLSVVGRKTGAPRTVVVSYFEYNGEYVIVGSAGGLKQDPQWIHNLAAAGQAQIQIGNQVQVVGARIADGAERDRLWRDVVVARFPLFLKYQEKSGRTIPVAVLTPRS